LFLDGYAAIVRRSIPSSDSPSSDEDWVLILRLVLQSQMGGHILFALVAESAENATVDESLQLSHLCFLAYESAGWR